MRRTETVNRLCEWTYVKNKLGATKTQFLWCRISTRIWKKVLKARTVPLYDYKELVLHIQLRPVLWYERNSCGLRGIRFTLRLFTVLSQAHDKWVKQVVHICVGSVQSSGNYAIIFLIGYQCRIGPCFCFGVLTPCMEALNRRYVSVFVSFSFPPFIV